VDAQLRHVGLGVEALCQAQALLGHWKNFR